MSMSSSTLKIPLITLGVFVLVVVGYIFFHPRSVLEPAYLHQNVNSAALNTNAQGDDQTAADAIWGPVLVAAARTTPVTFNGITFDVPSNMTKGVVEGKTVFSFPVDISEAPSIFFSTTTKTPSQVVMELNDSLSQFERIVSDTTTTIHGKVWRMVERTTDFGINEVTWITADSTTTVVLYQHAREDVTTVLRSIVTSAH